MKRFEAQALGRQSPELAAGCGRFTVCTVGVVTAAALGVAVAVSATLVPAVRASRTSTLLALAVASR